MSECLNDFLLVYRDEVIRSKLKIKAQAGELESKEQKIIDLEKRLDAHKKRVVKLESYKEKSQLLEKTVFFSNLRESREQKLKKKEKIIRLFYQNTFCKKDYQLLKASDLFSEEYYLSESNDLKNIDPIRHYLLFGAMEGRNPSEKFDTYFYLKNNKDLLNSTINPLVHYIKFGKSENRKAKPSD